MVLINPRQERFAQEIARGARNGEAYRAAGYLCRSEDSVKASACRLRQTPAVAARIADIQARAAVEAEITAAGITLALLQVAAEGRALKSAPGLATARAALMDAARLNGFLPDQKGKAPRSTHEDALAELNGWDQTNHHEDTKDAKSSL